MRFSCFIGRHNWIRTDRSRVIPLWTGDWIDREFMCDRCPKAKWAHG